jgi:hypothetical protein
VTVPEGNPANINLDVTSIDYAYKVCGRLLSVTSENAEDEAVNEVYYHFPCNRLAIPTATLRGTKRTPMLPR